MSMNPQYLKNKNEFVKKNLYGKVKLIKELIYNGEIIKSKDKISLEDELNSIELDLNLVNEEVVRGTLEEVNYFIFDENGNLIEDKCCDKNENLISQTKYVFNKKGEELEKHSYDKNSIIQEKIINEYDRRSNKIKEKKYNSLGLIEEQVIYCYDQFNNLNKEIIIDNSGSIISEMHFSYKVDSWNRVIERICVVEGRVIKIFRYNYQSNMTTINYSFYNEDGSLYLSESKVIDENGKILKDNSAKYTYDKFNNVIEIHQTMFEETIINYEYEYDFVGNWINRIEKFSYVSFDYYYECDRYHQQKHVIIIDRDIEYFENKKFNWWRIPLIKATTKQTNQPIKNSKKN